MTGYQPLFHIRCLHGYFADGVFRSAQLRPTPNCGRLLDRYGCLFRAYTGGASVYYDSALAGGRSLLQSFDETAPFAFTLTGSAAELANCTQIDPANTATSTSALACFSNIAENTVNIGGETCLLLHPPGKPLANGAVPLRPPQFVHPVAAAPVRLLNLAGKEVAGIEHPAIAGGGVAVDFSGVPDGRYSLLAGVANPFDFYLSNTSAAARWGAIEIFAGGPNMASLPEACRVLGAAGARQPPPEFAIALEPRTSIWRYFVVSQSSADRVYDDYRIEGVIRRNGNGNGNGIAPIAFNGPIRQRILDRDAWVFQSVDHIPLYERPADRHEFTLKSETRGVGAAGAVVLPYGQPAATRRQTGPDGQVNTYSDIYVYL